MKANDFLSIADLDPDEVRRVVLRADRMKKGESTVMLAAKVVVLLFEKPSLRTRVSFEVGIRQMGGDCVYLSGQDVGLGVREPEADVARVLDRWVDGIVARVNSHRSLEILAENTSAPVVNALSNREHPCQAIGDLLTIHEHKGRLDGLRVAFVGDGNNTAASLALACASVGADFVLACPDAYQLPLSILGEAERRASSRGSSFERVVEPRDAVRDADVVYTDVWTSMGQEGESADRLKAFVGYQVDETLMRDAKPDAIFMHDMPAHRGKEISEGMIDHPGSVVFDQAENRMHGQKAIVAELFLQGRGGSRTDPKA